MNKEELSICLDCLGEERSRLYELINSTQDKIAQNALNGRVAKIERLMKKLTFIKLSLGFGHRMSLSLLALYKEVEEWN